MLEFDDDIPDESNQVQSVRIKHPQEKKRTCLETLHKLNHEIDMIIVSQQRDPNLERGLAIFNSFKDELDNFIAGFQERYQKVEEMDLLIAICRKTNENEQIQEIVTYSQSKIEMKTSTTRENSQELNSKVFDVRLEDVEILSSEIPERLKKIESLVKEAEFFSDDQLIDQAQRKRLEIDEILKEYEVDPAYSEYIYEFRHKYDKLLVSIEKRFDFCLKNLKQLNDPVGWHTEKTEKGLKISYKQLPNTPTTSLLMEGIINVPIYKMIALASESEHMKEFVPFITETTTTENFHKARRAQYAFLNFPVITDRETYFYSEGFDRLDEDGTIVLMSKSIHDDKEFAEYLEMQNPIPPTSKQVRLDFLYYVYQIEPIDENSCKVRSITNVNPHVNFVPQSMINWIGRKFAYFLFEKMIAKANVGFETSVWAKAIEKNPEFYEWINKKVDNYLAKKKAGNVPQQQQKQ